MRHIAAVILNYNSNRDLRVSAEQIARQRGVRLSVIVVDNGSDEADAVALKEWLVKWQPDAVCGAWEHVYRWVQQNRDRSGRSGNVYLIEHHENGGYSAGNNIGIRLADALGADAVFIANPDMRIQNPDYLGELSMNLFANGANCIAASRIIGPDGKDQSPLREPTFFEELFWPRWYFSRFLKNISYIDPVTTDEPTPVEKVAGCCMLLTMGFLRSTNYLDEKVFLYCEEPILSARVRAAGGRIIYIRGISATHEHISSEKSDSAVRMLEFIRSRKYYLRTYSGYRRWQLVALSASYWILSAHNRLKRGWTR